MAAVTFVEINNQTALLPRSRHCKPQTSSNQTPSVNYSGAEYSESYSGWCTCHKLIQIS